MKILHLNKFASLVGGSESYMFEAAKRQAASGHEVAVAGGVSENSDPALIDGVPIFELPLPSYRNVPVHRQPQVAASTIWSPRQAERVRVILHDYQPDIVHVHLYAHQLTSSILGPLKSSGSRVIHTAHDYKLICPAYVASVDGDDCFACSSHVSIKLLRARCHHKSIAWSATVAAESLITRAHRAIPRHIVAPSKFMHDRLKLSWLNSEAAIHLIRNPADVDTTRPEWHGSGNYLLYVGRLSREKGVDELVRTAGALQIPLVIAGSGPEMAKIRSTASEVGARVNLQGWVDRSELDELRANCRAQIAPSMWPENAPLAVAEAAVMGVPLLVSNRGGMPEYADLGARLVALDRWDRESLLSGLRRLEQSPFDAERLRENLAWSTHLQKLDSLYGRVMD